MEKDIFGFADAIQIDHLTDEQVNDLLKIFEGKEQYVCYFYNYILCNNFFFAYKKYIKKDLQLTAANFCRAPEVGRVCGLRVDYCSSKIHLSGVSCDIYHTT